MVLAITIIVMIILAGYTIISIKNSDMIGKTDNNVNETNLLQVKDIANAAWAEAYGKGKMTQAELETAVYDALEKNMIEIDDYNIVVTEDDVTITIKE